MLDYNDEYGICSHDEAVTGGNVQMYLTIRTGNKAI